MSDRPPHRRQARRSRSCSFAPCVRDPEPGSVKWTIRMSFAGATSSAEPPAKALVELLGSLDVGDGDMSNLDLQSGYAGVRRSSPA